MTEWNEWRKDNPGEQVWLQGAYLRLAHLEGADLWHANLNKAFLMQAHLERASLRHAHLEGAKLGEAHLEGADLGGAHLNGANIERAHLEGLDAHLAVVDGETLLWGCTVDSKTDFSGVGLDAARVNPGLKQLLKYNVRRKRWREWYKEGPWPVRTLKRSFVQLFWSISDYGRSTSHIIGTFALLAVVFAAVYWASPGLLEISAGDKELHGLIHALYFSVVTMTTLGFGDIHANPASPCGQVLLMFQVMLGYILLGALVTRFAVLFTAEGPAARLEDDGKVWAWSLGQAQRASRRIRDALRRVRGTARQVDKNPPKAEQGPEDEAGKG